MGTRSGSEVVLVRHGETDWSRSGRHTSRTDLPLTSAGARQAIGLGQALAGRPFALVLSSPMRRALDTADLAGFGRPEPSEDLRELGYGDYEGRTTAEIQSSVPGWTVWTAPLVGGETLEQAATRADRIVSRIRVAGGDVLVFGHGHLLRILGARWCGLPAGAAAHLALDAASVSVLGYERTTPVIRSWNGQLQPQADR